MLCHDFLTEESASHYFSIFKQELQWEQSMIQVYGRRVPIPRLNAWYGDPDAGYQYSGTRLEPRSWTANLLALKQRVEKLTKHRFNSVLANLYRDGKDGVAWHSDDERELGENPVIASVSLGAVRRFMLKHRYDREESGIELMLPHGSLLVMAGETQRYWLHQVPKTAKAVGPRINLTFRTIV